MSRFPIVRPRRLRQDAKLRNLVRETSLSKASLVMPIFVQKGQRREPIAAMPGIDRLNPEEVLCESEKLLKSGVTAVLLFGVVAANEKDAQATAAYRDDGVVQETIRLLKQKLPELLVIADVCLCDYTDHGHCGLVVGHGEQRKVDNDSSLEVLSRIAGSMARAGADIVAPSDMMDGRVAQIRDELDAAGFKDLPIMSYAVKYASAFYGPFRDALNSSPAFGDRKTYQMDVGNRREALREAQQDMEEGADILIVKPAMTSLDILAELRQQVPLPLAAYQVSGEYSMIKLAAQAKLFDEKAAVLESWTVLARAGADILISYFARDYADLL